MDTEKEMKYAPVVIPTLCRYEHLVRCIESLRRNTWAEHTDVYVGLDYPAKESHWEGYRKIKAYLQGQFPEFRNLYVIEQSHNVGAGPNSKILVDVCAKDHDRYIYIEDDLEFSPNFLQYMDQALQQYENDESVAMVVGYSYPLAWRASEGATAVRQNFNGSAWGKGIWLHKIIRIVDYLHSNGLQKDFAGAYQSGRTAQMIDFALKDYVHFTESGWSGSRGMLNNPTDIAMRIYLAVQERYAIMPILSKVRNHGYDGSGVYCQRIEGNKNGEFCVDNYAFSQQPIDESETFELIEDTSFDLKANRDLLNAFDRVSPEEMKIVWGKAEKLARLGRYGGALLAGKKVLKKTAKRIGMSKEGGHQ